MPLPSPDGDTRFQTLFDALTDVVLVYPLGADGPGPFSDVNRAAVDRYGYAEDEFKTLTVLDLVAPDSGDVDVSLDQLRRLRQATFESTHRTRDGRAIPVQTSARMIEDGGQLFVVAVCRDDTERRAFRRELARANLGLERQVAERTAEVEAFAQNLKILHRITMSDYASSHDRTAAYLTAGCEMFGLPIGILSSLPVDPETGARLYRIEAVVSPDEAIPAGLTVPLADAFCDDVVATQDTVTISDASQDERLSCHSAHAERGLRSFIGAPMWIEDEIVGTLNFVSPEPRPGGFTPSQRDLVELMAEAVARRIQEERLEQSRAVAEGWYRSVFETVSDGLVVVNGDGDVLDANPAAREILGLGGSGPARNTAWMPVDEAGREIAPDALPEARALRDGVAVRGVVQGLRRADGRTRWYSVNATPYDQDHDGQPDAVVLSFSDVTDLRAARAALLDGTPVP